MKMMCKQCGDELLYPAPDQSFCLDCVDAIMRRLKEDDLEMFQEITEDDLEKKLIDIQHNQEQNG